MLIHVTVYPEPADGKSDTLMTLASNDDGCDAIAFDDASTDKKANRQAKLRSNAPCCSRQQASQNALSLAGIIAKADRRSAAFRQLQ